VRLLAWACACEAACPGVRHVSRREHDRYQRGVADTASGCQEMLIHLRARRFFCDAADGARPRGEGPRAATPPQVPA